MNEIIDAMLKTYCSDAFRATFNDVEEIIENFELEGLEDALTNIAMDNERYDVHDIPAVIHSTVYEYMTYLLRNHEVVPNSEASLQQIVLLLSAIWRMQDWIDTESIIRITENDSNPEEKFADLVALVEVAESVSVLESISSVSAGFIETLQKLYETSENDSEQFDVKPEYIQSLRLLKQFYKDVKQEDTNKIFVFKMIEQGVKVGGEFSFYYARLKKRFDSLNHDELARQLLPLVYLGSDSYKNIIEFWRKINEQIIDDPEIITKTDIAFNNLNNEFTTWQSNMERTFGKS